MSKSRLEKFLYALYSLDSSDLPNPLSRIEELYRCLVTGDEAPIFEPISRVEKYLMAILGGYDVDSLPNPLSRVEVLLYKLATGDDNLDDIKTFLSEHEELLAEIIRNGGVGGNIDIEYVLYTLSTEHNTLYNTAEKPIKSAILKGNTLVNMVAKQNFVSGGDAYNLLYTLDVPVKSNTTYTVYISLKCADKMLSAKESVFRIKKNNNSGADLIDLIQFQPDDITSSTELKVTIKNVDCEYFHVRLYNFKIEKALLMLLEGDHLSEDISYFEGMKSVQMPVLKTTGKNFFPTNNFIECGTDNVMVGQYNFDIYLKSGNYRISFVHADDSDKNTWFRCDIIDEQKNQVLELGTLDRTFTIEKDGLYKLKTGRGSTFNNTHTKVKIQIEEGSTATSYEPYKSNILTVNEDVTLRSNGDVYDELNLLTGRLTQRIDENNEVLSQEVVKTVDLSVVDQDGNNTKLSTFDDLTHVSLSSEGLIPEAELEVATKNEEVLNTMSLEMDDISATQNTLEETSDTQSENVDATMIATTEIYESLL